MAVIYLILWEALVRILNLPVFFPSPLRVLEVFLQLPSESGFLQRIFSSTANVWLGFSISLTLALLLFESVARFPNFKLLLQPLLSVLKSVPMISFIILLSAAFSSRSISPAVVFIVTFPLFLESLVSARLNEDPQLRELANLFQLESGNYRRYILLPQILPVLRTSSKTAMGMAWKAGVAAEVLVLIGSCIGEKLYESKIYLEISQLLAWTILIILLSLLSEKILDILFSLAEDQLCKI